MFQEVHKILNNGGIILYPTDTIWGIGCDATNEKAINKIYSLKQREETKSMLILVDSIEMLQNYVEEIPDIALKLIKSINKPLTIIYSGPKNLAQNLIASDNSIGIRITKDKICKEMINNFGKPIVSTSANISGEESPKKYEDINSTIINTVDYILKREKEIPSSPSTIIKVINNSNFRILRGKL